MCPPRSGLTENAFFRRTPERPARFVPGSPELRLISRNYLSVMCTRIVRGRGLAEGDAAGRPRVLLSNETTARRELPNQNPIGLAALSLYGVICLRRGAAEARDRHPRGARACCWLRSGF